jgi:hypothetical protein
MRLKTSEIRDWRIRQLGTQDYTCALCEDLIDPDEAVLDHCHKTGFIRKVLHRGCNSLLGKIENAMPRSRVDVNRLKNIAGNLIEYITTQHTEVFHPTYKTPEERKMKQAMGRGKGKKPPKR